MLIKENSFVSSIALYEIDVSVMTISMLGASSPTYCEFKNHFWSNLQRCKGYPSLIKVNLYITALFNVLA